MTANQPANPTPGERHARIRRSARREFDGWAASYDRSPLNGLVFFPGIRAVQEEVGRWQGGRGGGAYGLLDVGCGTGTLLAVLAGDTDATELVGLDYSPEMVRLAGDKLAGCEQPDRLRVIQGDAEHLPFEPASFDVLTCCHSFHHYPHQAAVLRGCHRVLRPGGMLVLIDGFRDNVIGWVIFDVLVALVERHVHHAAWSEIRQMATEAGFPQLQQRKLNVLAPLLVNVARR